MANKEDKCCFPGCGEESDVIWLSEAGLCMKHWSKICDNPIEYGYKKLNISEQAIEKNNSLCDCHKQFKQEQISGTSNG